MAHPSEWSGLNKLRGPEPEPNTQRKAPCDKEHCGQCPNEQNGTRENRKRTQEVKRPWIIAVPTLMWPKMGEQKRYTKVEERHREDKCREQENKDSWTRNLQHPLPASIAGLYQNAQRSSLQV